MEKQITLTRDEFIEQLGELGFWSNDEQKRAESIYTWDECLKLGNEATIYIGEYCRAFSCHRGYSSTEEFQNY